MGIAAAGERTRPRASLAAAARWLVAALVAVVALTARAGGADDGPATLSVLTYNTHGLPGWIAGDAPERRIPAIGRRLARYDVALIQEDFAHHAALREAAQLPVVLRGGASRMPWCPVCSGDGLTFLAGLVREAVLAAKSTAFPTCAGWLGGANDCLATKGFQRVRLALPGGGVLDLVNTHLDAGTDEADRAARRVQLATLAANLRREAGEGALILGGDLNLDADDPDDSALLEAFRAELGLSDSGARARPDVGWRRLDYLLYRSGSDLGLEVMEAGEDAGFAQEGAPLSDHPALFARFRVRPAPSLSASWTSRRPPGSLRP